MQPNQLRRLRRLTIATLLVVGAFLAAYVAIQRPSLDGLEPAPLLLGSIVVHGAFYVLALVQALRLLGQFERREIFVDRSIGLLRSLGRVLIVLGLLPFVRDDGPGPEVMFRFELGAVFCGVLFIVLAGALAEGKRAVDEQALTV